MLTKEDRFINAIKAVCNINNTENNSCKYPECTCKKVPFEVIITIDAYSKLK